ncbi:hypothetical protein NQU47_01430 [Pseudoalteromonas distincta]|uniref:hypothetical protein n=1 Tax=Pseudoalteromonas distincta TaxID=77608 RepID=UPI0023412C73|nr:hypothetical protein [Pseudoalteromonas distincta]MDC3211214.1 hypothetical protein [Pseudoalteromonas distincta]
MKSISKAILFLSISLCGYAHAQNHLTLNYQVTKELNHFAYIKIKVTDKYLRTDYILPNKTFTEMTIRDDGQYILDHQKNIAYRLDYLLNKEGGDQALTDMMKYAPGFTKEQIYEMSLDPKNDPNNYIAYEKEGENLFIGYFDDEKVQIVKTSSFPNQFLSSAEYTWLLKRAREDTYFGKTFVGFLDVPLIDFMRKFKYDTDQLPTEITLHNEGKAVFLKTVSNSEIDESEVEIEPQFMIKDITNESVQFLKNLESIAREQGVIE